MRERVRKAFTALHRAVDLQDVFAFGGLGCVGYGLGQVYPPAAWIVVGAALFWLGVKSTKGR